MIHWRALEDTGDTSLSVLEGAQLAKRSLSIYSVFILEPLIPPLIQGSGRESRMTGASRPLWVLLCPLVVASRTLASPILSTAHIGCWPQDSLRSDNLQINALMDTEHSSNWEGWGKACPALSWPGYTGLWKCFKESKKSNLVPKPVLMASSFTDSQQCLLFPLTLAKKSRKTKGVGEGRGI